MRASSVHIAGVGVGGADNKDGHRLDELAISAATKAMLDAGITYDDVDTSITCFQDFHSRVSRSTLNAFGMRGTPVLEVDNASGLPTAFSSIRSGQANCTLVIGLDRQASGRKVLAVALVLVSQLFLASHAYLKDSAVEIKACSQANRVHSRSAGGPNEAHTSKMAVDKALRLAGVEPGDVQIVDVRQGSNANAKTAFFDFKGSRTPGAVSSLGGFTGTTGFAGLGGLVWQLRGWGDQSASGAANALQYTSGEDSAATVLILRRSDGQAVPTFDTIQNLRDGRERLGGYNPASVARAISREDLEAVRAREEFTTDDALQQLRLRVKGGDRAALARL